MFCLPLKRFVKEERAQDLIEYTLLIAFLALVSVGLMSQAGGSLTGIWGGANATLAQAVSGPTTSATPVTPPPPPPPPPPGGDHDGQ